MNQQATNAVPKTPAYAWVILFTLYLATLSATLTLSKIMPVSTIIQKAFGVDMTTAEPFQKTMAAMNRIMDEIEAILDSN